MFEFFDFWDGCDVEVDVLKIGDVIRCVGFNLIFEIVRKNGGIDKMGKSFIGWYVKLNEELVFFIFKEWLLLYRNFWFCIYIIVFFF